MRRPSMVVSGALARRPGKGGHAWVFLQYLLGFRKLGWDVLFLDHIEPSACADERGAPASPAASANVRYLAGVMRRFGLGTAWSLSFGEGRPHAGLPRDRVVDRVRDAEIFLNVMGYCTDPEVLEVARRRVFLDIDPGFGQMWAELGLADLFEGHDHFVTIGENIGAPGCDIPTCGRRWIRTPQPVVLEHWPPEWPGALTSTEPPHDMPGPFSSVVSWRGPFAPIEYRGRTFGLRVHEFRRYADLPGRTGERFVLAVDIDPADAKDRRRLEAEGWELVDPQKVASCPHSYRDFIWSSGAELMVAKQLYVVSRSGWLSDRSLCYLAAGRPVVTQDTGLAELYPLGEGLLAFSTPEEAAAAIEEVRGDYRRHARAARDLAAEHFDSDRVLGRLVSELAVA